MIRQIRAALTGLPRSTWGLALLSCSGAGLVVFALSVQGLHWWQVHALSARAGRAIWFLMSLGLVGAVLGCALLYHRQRVALAALQARSPGPGAFSEQELEPLIDALPVIVWAADPTGRVDYVTPNVRRAFDLDPGQILAGAWASLLHPGDGRVGRRWQEHVASGAPFEAEVRLGNPPRHPYRWFLCRASAIRDETGRTVRWIGTAADVDDRLRSRAVLLESEERYRSLVELLPEGVMLLDGEGNILAANAMMGRMFHVDEKSLVGLSALSTSLPVINREGTSVPPEGFPSLQSLRTGKPQRNVELGLRWPDGLVKWISVNTQPLFREGEARPYAVICVLSDITERVDREVRLCQAHQALSEANEQLRKLDTYKDDFLRVVSHEIKGPLATIMGFGGLLEEEVYGTLNEGQQACVAGIVETVERLALIVNDLRDLGAIRSGTLRVYPQPAELPVIVASALGGMGVLAEENGLTIRNEVPADLPLIYADAQRVHQILVNLLTNAIKFTPGGGQVRVRASTEGGRVRIEVEDTGRGISPDDLPTIFNRFVQLEADRGQRLRGSGLGLSICKALVAAHGGDIGVVSDPGKGSTFWFTLPVADEAGPVGA